MAEKAGLTKRTLYYHFESKDELLAAVLDHRGELALEHIRRWAAGLKGDAETFVEGLFSELSRWASRPGWEGAGFTRVVMELADLPGHPARAIARRHKAAVEAWLTQELASRKVRQSALAARGRASRGRLRRTHAHSRQRRLCHRSGRSGAASREAAICAGPPLV